MDGTLCVSSGLDSGVVLSTPESQMPMLLASLTFPVRDPTDPETCPMAGNRGAWPLVGLFSSGQAVNGCIVCRKFKNRNRKEKSL